MLTVMFSCAKEKDYDSQISDLERRVSALEKLCSEMNSNISSLKGIVQAVQNGDYITSVSPITENGKEVGYTINFAKGKPITVYHGKDGADGKDGQDGKDGKDGTNGQDGHTPLMGVKQDTDGVWYWTIDGKWMLDTNNQKVKAIGVDGKDGTDGKDGITPQLKIEEGYWYVSTDNGQTWTKLGKATGENGQNGKDGDSMFKSVTVTDTEVTFVTADGQTFVVWRVATLSIEFDSADLVVMGTNATRDIHYTITSESDDIMIEALSSADIKVKLDKTDAKKGTLQVKTGATIDEYSKVVVLVNNCSQSIMRTLRFEEEAIVVEENTTKEVTDEGGEITLEFFSNVSCHAVIPAEAQSWISVAPETKSMTKQSIGLIVQPNIGLTRSATVNVVGDDDASNIVLSYTVIQEPNHEAQLAIERESLIALYNSTNGDNWHDVYGNVRDVRENWCSSKTVSSWHGITCNSEGNVIEINLAGAALHGILPEEMGNLIELRKIYLQSNEITGNIPKSFARLKNLEVLVMQGNKLYGSIPAFIGTLTKLKELALHQNYFTGSIPDNFVNLKELTDLRLCDNLLSGSIPTSFYNWNFWKSWWGLSLRNNLYNFEDIDLPGPKFNVHTLSNRQLNSDDVYASHQYTILFQWYTKDNFEYFIKELRDIAAKYGDEIQIISWANSNADKEEDAVEFFMEKSIPGEFFYWDYADYNETKDTTHLRNTFGTVPWYPANYYTSLTVVDKNGKIVLSDLFSEQYNPCINLSQELLKWLNGSALPDMPNGYYNSTDYSLDGELSVFQRSSVDNGPNLIIMGDGFSDRQQGLFNAAAEKAYLAFFSEEPYSSFKNLFNVYRIRTISKNELYEVGCETALSCTFGGGSYIDGDKTKCIWYTMNAGIDPASIDRTIILVIINRDYYAGTCHMYGSYNGSWGEGLSIAFCPTISDDILFRSIISHEAGGHGFAKLADEYAYEYMGAITADAIASTKVYETYGWWKNVDFTSNPSQVKWSQFLSDPRYASEGLGCYEGGLTYWTGVWRPTENSIMRDNTSGFNAPSRYAIWYRIGKLAYGENWEGSYEDFVAYDAVNITPAAIAKRQSLIRSAAYKDLPYLHAPVVVNHSWREELQINK